MLPQSDRSKLRYVSNACLDLGKAKLSTGPKEMSSVHSMGDEKQQTDHWRLLLCSISLLILSILPLNHYLYYCKGHTEQSLLTFANLTYCISCLSGGGEKEKHVQTWIHISENWLIQQRESKLLYGSIFFFSTPSQQTIFCPSIASSASKYMLIATFEMIWLPMQNNIEQQQNLFLAIPLNTHEKYCWLCQGKQS